MSDDNGGQPVRKPLPKNALHEFKLRLLGPMQEGARRQPTLSVGVIKNQVRLDVFTNVPNDRDNGKISAPMDSLTFFAFLDQLEQIIAGEPDNQIQITNKTGRPGDTRMLSKTVVGKDKEGRVFISVTAQDRPRIKFVFLPTEYHTLVKRDGTPLTEAELSMSYSRAWHKLMCELVPNVLDTHYVEPEPRPQGGGGYNRGGGGGGYNNNRGGGGGYNKGGYNNNRGGGGGNNYNRGNGGGGNNYNRNNNGGGGGGQPASGGGGGESFDDFPM